MKKLTTNEIIITTLCVVLFAIILALLISKASQNEQQQKDALANLHAKELALCWNEIEDGQICKIEYIYDRTNTPIGAKVIKQEGGK